MMPKEPLLVWLINKKCLLVNYQCIMQEFVVDSYGSCAVNQGCGDSVVKSLA